MKLNLANFFRNTSRLALAKIFPSENFPLYGNQDCAVGQSIVFQSQGVS